MSKEAIRLRCNFCGKHIKKGGHVLLFPLTYNMSKDVRDYMVACECCFSKWDVPKNTTILKAKFNQGGVQ
jgi:hypothetical protein